MEEDRVSSLYYREVGAHAIPTAEQERVLFTQYRDALDSGNRWKATKIRHQIAHGYLKFVVQRAHHRTKNPDLRLELIAEGNIGLLVAIDKFDVLLGHRFLTYGASWIDVYMREHINRSLPVHVPSHKRKELRRKRVEEDRLIAQGRLRDYTETEPVTTSIDNVVVPAHEETEHAVQQRETRVLNYLKDAGLPPRERFVLTHHYALRGGSPKSLRDIAALFYIVDGSCVLVEELKTLLHSALKRLNEYMKQAGLETVLDAL